MPLQYFLLSRLHNDTYPLDHLLPIIFAVQNPQAAVGLLAKIRLSLLQGGGPTANTTELMTDRWIWNNFTTIGNEPYFVALETIALNGAEGQFTLQWDLLSTNCSATEHDERNSSNLKLGLATFSNFTEFTLRKGASHASSGFVTTPDSCPISVGTFNVTGTLPVDRGLDDQLEISSGMGG